MDYSKAYMSIEAETFIAASNILATEFLLTLKDRFNKGERTKELVTSLNEFIEGEKVKF